MNCLDISESKSRFPDKNNLFSCLPSTKMLFFIKMRIFIFIVTESKFQLPPSSDLYITPLNTGLFIIYKRPGKRWALQGLARKSKIKHHKTPYCKKAFQNKEKIWAYANILGKFKDLVVICSCCVKIKVTL